MLLGFLIQILASNSKLLQVSNEATPFCAFYELLAKPGSSHPTTTDRQLIGFHFQESEIGRAMNELRLPCGRETRKLVWALFLGQVVSLLLALGSLASSLIADLGVDAPLSQSLFAYVLLAVVCGGIMLYRRQRLLVPWYWYLLLGFVDVQGNYLFNKAYQYSSITSITLLDCFTIAWVIGLTRIFLGTRYSLWQVLGAAICVVGLGLVLLSDAGVAGGGGSRPLLGDVLVIGATFFYASSNVSEEFFVKKKDLVELIAMLGLFGAVVSICEICIFEIKSLESVAWSTEIILAGCGYTLTTFLFYLLMPLVMQHCSICPS
uniref:Solute carrier family 35 member F2 n=2 Tax=Kalanchoe fedtschenkoi TaxID=63787 RepID=A0A7N0VKE1_KALFE